MKSAEIRESFLSYFESKGCRRWPSSSLIPDDPSLLLTTAGMVQFKPVFLGKRDLGFTRATTVQKCVRTTDIDIIGTTGRHHSFFEMLGNFSFGDYFKSEACAWAYEYSIEVLGFDVDRLWFSIFEDDDEAEAIWRDEIGVNPARIVRMGAKDNFWSAGPTGPCGPCSELYYDQGPEVGCGSEDCAPGCDCDRFLEYWNLVFMQYDRQEDGTLQPLPKCNIDTGMGLERVATILQGVHSNFETDILRAIIEVAEQITGAAFGGPDKSDTSLRILADHARAVSFMIADGILPSNEGRGYVLRRLLRRAVRHGRLLGVEEPFMNKLVDKVIELMGEAYGELLTHKDLIDRIVATEEERFGATLRTGMTFLETALGTLPEGTSVLDGSTAFALHDTYGFPLELTAEIAAERGVAIDEAGFSAEMEAQRERARSHVKDDSWNTYGGAASELAREIGPTDFAGYEKDETASVVKGILVEGVSAEQAKAGDKCELILDTTPFYAEQGGQVGDTGTIESASGARLRVEDTKLIEGRVHLHSCVVEEGTINLGDEVLARIDVWRRERIRRNHTATHLLHWSLRKVLGEHATQAGSMVSPDRLRFDFTHFESVTAEQLAEIEQRVNRKVFENHPVRSYETSLASAREAGVTALFGEKYGEFVRVLECGLFSRELCGGTHVARTSEIGFVKVVSEGSVGANLRRIEAVTSMDAYEYILAEEAQLASAATAMKVPPRDVADKAASLAKRVKELESGAGRAQAIDASALSDLVGRMVDVGYKAIVAEIGKLAPGALRSVWDSLRERGADAVVLVGTDPDSGKAVFIAAGNDAAVAAGFDAGGIVKEIAPMLGGRGGGKPGMAQGGGDDASRIADAVSAAQSMVGGR